MKKAISKKNCTQCGKVYIKPYFCSKKDWLKSKFCSTKCHGLSMIGIIPWNKGVKYNSKMKTNLNLKGLRFGQGWNKGVPSEIQNEQKSNWKGEKVSYSGVHHWISRKLGKPSQCEHCKKNISDSRLIHWANKDHKYKRNLNDWIRLCITCHSTYDQQLA